MWSYSARRLKIRFDLLSNRGDSHSKLLGENRSPFVLRQTHIWFHQICCYLVDGHLGDLQRLQSNRGGQ